ncbi:MAG: site-specific DNA-methyltransferase [Bacteroidetes bacterium]|nr:site-specific DNA-methyltransferase [Bacteroidota bacterium]
MFEQAKSYKFPIHSKNNYIAKLDKCLSGDLNFHGENGIYLSHNFHSFPAKFPPQLPRKFILELTNENDFVLDPMMGSGTTILEAVSNNRLATGFDIDPLALLITSVKTSVYNKTLLIAEFNKIIVGAEKLLNGNTEKLTALYNKFDDDTRAFIEYWFHKETVRELLALSHFISKVESEKIQNFFKVIFSSIIITKSGGVSLAMDLAHTRPHRAKTVIDPYSEPFFEIREKDNSQNSYTTKRLKRAVGEFQKKFYQNLESVITAKSIQPELNLKSSQCLTLKDASVDLIVTSPPYAANAIDYMRAHKFSLLWFGFSINDLKEKEKNILGTKQHPVFR